MAAGLIGAALFYGDGVITPAISVLSAVEGLKVATPIFDPYVVPISLALLVGLFLVQRHGTAAIGGLFGPIMLLWFAVLALLGLWNVAQHPAVCGRSIRGTASRCWRAPLAGVRDARRSVSGGDRRRDLVRRYGPFRPQPAARRVALSRPAGAGDELLRAGRASAARRPALENPFYRLVPSWGSIRWSSSPPRQRSSPRKPSSPARFRSRVRPSNSGICRDCGSCIPRSRRSGRSMCRGSTPDCSSPSSSW